MIYIILSTIIPARKAPKQQVKTNGRRRRIESETSSIDTILMPKNKITIPNPIYTLIIYIYIYIMYQNKMKIK